MAGAKGQDSILYIDVDADDQYVVVGCFNAVKPPGYSRAIISEDPCLDETAQFDDTDILKYSTLTAQIVFDNSTNDIAIQTAIIADTDVKAAVKLNLSTPWYATFSCKFTLLEFQEWTKDKRARYLIELVIRSAPAWGTVAPTLEA